MKLTCRFVIIPDGSALEYHGVRGDSYETALISLGIIPDTVLIFHGNQSIPQDEKINVDEVRIVATCSRG